MNTMQLSALRARLLRAHYHYVTETRMIIGATSVSNPSLHRYLIVSFPDPAPLRGKQGLGTLVDFLGILCVSNHVTHAYAHAHFSNKRVIRELRIVSCPGGGVWVAVTREFERDNCVISEILQSDWTIPNRAGVPRKSTKVPRPSFRVWAGRSGHETRYLT